MMIIRRIKVLGAAVLEVVGCFSSSLYQARNKHVLHADAAEAAEALN